MMDNMDSLSQDAPPKQKTIDQEGEQRDEDLKDLQNIALKYFDPPEAVPQ